MTSLTGFARRIPSLILSLVLLLDSLAAFARWILSLDSLADSLAQFARWILLLDSLADSLAGLSC